MQSLPLALFLPASAASTTVGEIGRKMTGDKETGRQQSVAREGIPGGGSIPRTGGAGSLHQKSIYPDMDVDLDQWPWEGAIQCYNCIYTSEIPPADRSNADISQDAEFRDVRFRQFYSPSSINTVNATLTNAKPAGGSIEQSFKFRSIEMAQTGSAGSIHAMNYLGDTTR